MNRSTAKVIERRAAKKQDAFAAKCKALPHAFFIKHEGRNLKNPHYTPKGKRK